MGDRAIFKIYSNDHDGAFYAHWASPEFIMSGLAHWIEACRWRHQIPSAANYWEHVQVNPANQFTDARSIDEPYQSDLNYRYELKAIEAMYGWGADLTVWTNVHDGPHTEYRELHRLSVSNLYTREIHAVAAAGMRGLAQRANNRPDRFGYSAEEVDHWARQGEIHDAYAAVNETGDFVTRALAGLGVAK